MKNCAIKVIFIVTAIMILPRLALTEPLTKSQPQVVWGVATNGVCAGISIVHTGWGSSQKDDIYCNIELGNMTTNFLWTWFPRFEQRYEIELRGPDGDRIRQVKPLFHSQKTLWSGLPPLSTNSTSCSLDWFFLKDTFDVRTNGQFTLITSVRASVFTNFIAGQSKMQSQPTYFLLPPVTNKFNMLLEQVKK